MRVRKTRHLRGRRAVLPCILCSAAVVSGCKQSDRPQVVRVTGRVLYRDQPVEGAQVRFTTPASPRIAYGKTNADGRFILTTFETNDGAFIGEHRVAVFKFGPPEPADATQTTAVPGMSDVVMESAPGKNELPARYQNPQQSELRATVTAQRPNVFTFKLTDETDE